MDYRITFSRITIATSIFLCFAFCFNAQTQQNEQEIAISGFYKTIMTFKEGGIPSRKNIYQLMPFISSGFRNLMLKARKMENRHLKKTKNTEPPLYEGSLFYSLFEGADKYTAINAETDKKQVTYLVDLQYTDPYDKDATLKWQDRVFLIKEKNKWVVNDLELLGKWQFGAKGKVSDILKEVISSR